MWRSGGQKLQNLVMLQSVMNVHLLLALPSRKSGRETLAYPSFLKEGLDPEGNSIRSCEIETWKKFRLNRIWTQDLCDTGVVLHQLSYQAIWETDSLWVRNILVEGEECKRIYERLCIPTAEKDMKTWTAKINHVFISFSGVWTYGLTMWQAPRWLDGSVSGAPQQYRRGHVLQSRLGLLKLWRLIISWLLKLCITVKINHFFLGHTPHWLLWKKYRMWKEDLRQSKNNAIVKQ